MPFRLKRLVLIALLTALSFGCGSSNDQAAVLFPSDQTSARLQTIVDETVQAQGIPGLALGLWQPGSEPIIILNGLARIEPARVLQANDRFRIGSVTKSFTVLVLLQLAEEQRLSLDDPISNYFPTISNGSATLEQLANMTSGIFNYTEDPTFLNDFIVNLDQARPAQELIDAAERGTPYFAPGAAWRYSNTNTVLLGLVIEQVTGNSLQAEIQNRILTPLAMGGTSYPANADMPTPFASGYALFDVNDLRDESRVHPSASAGSGALVSRLEDLRLWGTALSTGSLLQADTFARQLNLVPTLGQANSPEYDSYGLGIGSLGGWLGHTGDYIGYQALVMANPDTGAVMVILVNLKDLTEPEHLPTDIFRRFLAL